MVSIDGVDTYKRRPDILQEIFIVPEEFDLPAMTLDCYVRINEPFYPRFSHEVLEKCLADFELPRSLRLDALSMGQKKKVFMSFALAAGTRLLLMDEPTNGLDIPSKMQFRKVVAGNMSDDRILIISTHQVHDVEALLDHILILTRNRLLLNASVGDICHRYAFEYRTPGSPLDDVLYSEPSVQGNAVVSVRKEEGVETPLNLELLFNAVTMGKINQL
jgi:ABC-2 type transport system ATP-binding protein